MKKFLAALVLAAILLSIPGNLGALAGGAVTTYPTFVIKAVDQNSTVTIMTDNLPPNEHQ